MILRKRKDTVVRQARNGNLNYYGIINTGPTSWSYVHVHTHARTHTHTHTHTHTYIYIYGTAIMLLICEPPFVKLIWLCLITQLDSTRSFHELQDANKSSASFEIFAAVTSFHSSGI